MKRILSLPGLLLAALPLVSHSQVLPSTQPDTLIWKKKLNFALNLNQAAFSSNWKAGGINAFGFNTLFSYVANYKRDRNSWDSDIDLAYGFVNNSGVGYRKTMDRLYLDTKYGYDLSHDWGVFAALNFTSQFANGYQYPDDNSSQLISGLFSPAFITGSLGFEYHPVDYFKVRIAPIAPRITVVRNPARFVPTIGPEPYGVNPNENVRYEWLGFNLLAEFNKDIFKNVNLKWRYVMFANYEELQGKRLDHRLDVDLIAKAGKYVNIALGGILLYDYDQDNEAQLSQVFSIGFLYTFQNYVEPEK